MRLIPIFYHFEDGSWWADSPGLPGWTCVAESFSDVRTLAIEGAIEFAGEPVMVEELLPEASQSTGVLREIVSGNSAMDTQNIAFFAVSAAPFIRKHPMYGAPANADAHFTPTVHEPV